jgi:hypothetical protein
MKVRRGAGAAASDEIWRNTVEYRGRLHGVNAVRQIWNPPSNCLPSPTLASR